MYTNEQIFYFLFYRMKRIHHALDRLRSFLRSNNISVPQPPRRLMRHHVRVRKDRIRLELWLEEETDGLSLHLDLTERGSTGDYYRSRSMHAPSLDYTDPPSKPMNHNASAANHIARVMAVRPRSVDSVLWYFGEIERWLEHVQRRLEEHRHHLQDQRRLSRGHRRFLEALREVENELLVERIGG